MTWRYVGYAWCLGSFIATYLHAIVIAYTLALMALMIFLLMDDDRV